MKPIYDKTANDAYWVRLNDTIHGSFVHAALIQTPVEFGAQFTPGVRVSHITRAYLVSFFRKFLKDQDDHLLDGPSADYPEVTEFLKK